MNKKSFKIVLNSVNIGSYTGNEFDATYSIDLTQVIRNPDDYKKSYYMYCAFYSNADKSNIIGIESANLYTLALDLQRANNNYNYDNQYPVNFVLPVNVNPPDDVVGTLAHVSFKLNDNEQRPQYIDNILNLNNIRLTIYDDSLNIFNNATMNYICILTFVEC